MNLKALDYTPAVSLICKALGLPFPVAEYRFHPRRKWAFDFAFVAEKVALEIEGGTWTQGRHTRGKGWREDRDKYLEANLLGWLVIRCTPQEMTTGAVAGLLSRALGARGK
jgi:very-short-patch-repair endonuclease